MARASATELRLVLALALLTPLAGVACSESDSPAKALDVDAGSDAASAPAADAADAAQDAATACTLPGRFGSAKCDTCVTAQCCDRLGACAGDPSCATLSSCILACIDVPDAGGCASGCRARTADDAGLWSALEKCAYFSEPCAFECSVTPH
jgi:hypothetical protein